MSFSQIAGAVVTNWGMTDSPPPTNSQPIAKPPNISKESDLWPQELLRLRAERWWLL